MPKKDPESPATTSLAYDMMAPRWEKMDALLGGTETMRAAGTTFLPQYEEESDKAWQERLSMNVLFNMTELILDSWVGRPFSDPIVLGEDMPPAVRDLMGNVDLQGNNLDVFARNWFKDGLAKAVSYVLVDFPRVMTEQELGRPRSLADDVRESARPYWVHIPPENLIAGTFEIVDGREVPVHVRIWEESTAREGFSERVVQRIRQLDAGLKLPDGTSTPTTVKVWELIQRKGQKPKWEVVEEFPIKVSYIPLVPFYSDRDAPMIGKSPLLDLADLNIRHWQSNSDQIRSLSVARFPILACSGAISDDKVRLGPYGWLNVPDPNGKWYYVEHTGAAIQQGAQDLKNLETQMAEYGAEFLKRRPGRETATARALDSAEATSPLQDATLRFNDALNTALSMTADWLGLPDGGSAKVASEFGPEAPETADLDALANARSGRDISQEVYLSELQRRGVLADSFDFAKNESELKKEQVEKQKQAEADAMSAAKAKAEAEPEPAEEEVEE